jgi:phage gp36-like protein
MSYCTQSDLLKIIPEQDLVQLTDDTVPAAEINDDNVDKAISDAGELIDGYLRDRYSLPLAPVPGLIGTLAADIAVYRLYARRAKLDVPEGVTERYKGAIKLLEQIQKGAIALGAGSVATPESDSSESVSFTSQDRIFTRNTMKGF